MSSIYAPTVIDLSRVPAPEAIETVSVDALQADFKTRFLDQWELERVKDPTLDEFTEADIETHPVIVVARTWAWKRVLDRQRVNDALKALLAPLAKGANLENITAGRNIPRLVVAPATDLAPAIMESDEALLRRYLLSFDRPAAGSRDRYLYEAWAAWPQSEDRTLGLWDARVNGFQIHGRRGDTDLVIIGPNGRLPTEPERLAIRAAVTAPNIKPEAVSIAVLAARRATYSAHLVIEVPGIGPAPEIVQAEAEKRIRAAATARILIGGEVPAGLLAGAAYGDNVIRVRDLAPVVIAADAYAAPVMTGLTIDVEVRQ